MKELKAFLKKLVSYASSPDFLIIGAQKAGTTSLDSYLKYHPKLQGTHPKELHFFDNKMIRAKGLKWYANHFRRYYFQPKKLLFESTPNYLVSESAPKELHALNPNLKLIILLRDPIKRAYSAYNMFKSNYESQRQSGAIQNHLLKYVKDGEFVSFSEVIEKELRQKATESEENSFNILHKGRYAQQLKNWLEVFPKEQFLILEFNSFTQNPLQTLHKVAEFLDISSFDSLPIDFRIRNKRDYAEPISNTDKTLLTQFFEADNRELKALLGDDFDFQKENKN